MPQLYDSPSQMEPLLAGDNAQLTALALDVAQQAAALGAGIHAITAQTMARLVRTMNSYYSNLIEGHKTHPRDIEKAMRKDFSSDPRQRALQHESKAHIDVEELINARLEADPALNVCDSEFICWIHREFYRRMPAEFSMVKAPGGKELRVKPGELRKTEVEVGRHVPPVHSALPLFLRRFKEAYNPQSLNHFERIVAAAASHHRLAWIHPFLDGNGRVIRLFSHAYLRSARLDGHGLWTISRGLARHRDGYMRALAFADEHRLDDFDGRGNLSQKALVQFCTFFLQTALDQIRFMQGLFDFDRLHGNIERYVQRRKLKPPVANLLSALVFCGELPRGEAGSKLELSSSQSRVYLKKLLSDGILISPSAKGPLRLGIPLDAALEFFPKLYPAEVEFGGE